MTYTNEPNYEKPADFLNISVIGQNGEIVDTAQVPFEPVEDVRAVQISGVALQLILNRHGSAANYCIAYPHALETSTNQTQAHLSDIPEEQLFYGGFMKIRPHGKIVTLGDEPLGLTLQEYKLLEYLSRTPGSYLTRNSIFRDAWMDGNEIHPTEPMTRTVDAHVKRVRRKADPILTANGIGSSLIQSRRGFGYGFFPEPS